MDVVVQNPGGTRLPAGRLDLSMDAAPVASTSALLTGDSSIGRPSSVLLGQLTRTSVRTPAVDPGASASVRARISADDADGILTSADGARLLYVRLIAGSQRIVAESAIVRMSGSAPKVGFGTVVPITAPAGTTGVVDTDDQASLTAADGEWTRALQAARAMPSAVLALDPAVLASIRLAGEDAPPSAQQLLTDLAALPNEVVQLPYADGDVTLQRAAGLSGRTSPTSFTGTAATPAPSGSASASAVPTPAPSTTPPTSAADLTDWDWSGGRLLWPVPGTSTAADVAALSSEGTVLLGGADVQQTASEAAAGPATSVNGSRTVVAEATASRLLSIAAEGGATGDAALAPLVAALATDAVTSATPSVLAVAGRGAPGADLDRVLRILQAQRWIRGEGLETMTSRRAGAATLEAKTVAANRVATARDLVESERTVQQLSTAVPDAAALTGGPRLAMLALLSAQWSGALQPWQSAAASTAAELRSYGGRVSILPADPRTLTGVDAKLQVVVQNTLPQAVRVDIAAVVDNGRLRFTGTRPLRLVVPPNGTNRTQLSISTIANGPAQITLRLLTPDGAQIGKPAVRAITVRAGLDTIVAVVLLAALGLLLALGVYRNVTRRRRPRPAR